VNVYKLDAGMKLANVKIRTSGVNIIQIPSMPHRGMEVPAVIQCCHFR
jgi:hypothetical protein